MRQVLPPPKRVIGLKSNCSIKPASRFLVSLTALSFRMVQRRRAPLIHKDEQGSRVSTPAIAKSPFRRSTKNPGVRNNLLSKLMETFRQFELGRGRNDA